MIIKKFFQQKLVLKVIILLLVVVIGEIAFVHYRLGELESEYEVLNDLKNIKLLDQKIEQLFNNKITYQSYDDMVANTDLMSQKISQLKLYQVFDKHNDNYEELSFKYQILLKKLNQFKEIVEHYKSWNGITINSIRYLFDLHPQIQSYVYKSEHLSNRDQISFLLDEIINAVSKINFNRSDNINHLKFSMNDLLNTTKHDEILNSYVKNMAQHTNMVIKGLNHLTDLEKENKKLLIGDDIDRLHALFLNSFELKDEQYQYIINSLQSIVLLLIILLFIAQHKEAGSQTKIILLNKLLKEKLQKIEEINERMSTLLHQFDVNVIASKTDIIGNITYASSAFVQISGYSKDELIGVNHNIVRHPDMPNDVYEDLWRTIKSGKIWHGEIKNLKKTGGYYWVDVAVSPEFDKNDNIIAYSAIRHDITAKKELEQLSKTLEQKVAERTEELRVMVDKIEQLSVTDELTGLFNRRQYVLIIERQIKQARRNKECFCYLTLDLDLFKAFNDTYGHYQGDELLTRVADELKKFFQRPNDYIFRMGGEEFTAIFSVKDYHNGINMAENIIKMIANLHIEHSKNSPYQVVTFSAGLVINNQYEVKITEDYFYKQADSLLYKAKELGRNRLQYKVYKQ